MVLSFERLSLFRPRWVLPLLALLLSLLSTELLIRFETLDRLESVYSDIWHQKQGKRTEAEHVSLLLIDEQSLNTYKDTPLSFWTPLFAKAAHILRENGATVIGMDFLFSTTAEQWLRRFSLPETAQNYDQPLREELSKGNVVLVTTTLEGNDGFDQIILPVIDFWLSLPGQDLEKFVAFANLPRDPDGVIRKYLTELPLHLPPDIAESNRPRYNFGTLLALHARQYDPAFLAHIKSLAKTRRPIVFAGPPKTIPSISFAELIKSAESGTPLSAAMKNKIAGRVVIIGSDYGGLNDIHITPYGTGLFADKNATDTQWMSGPEIQANITESLLADKKIEALPPFWRGLLTLVTLSLACAAFRYWPTWAGFSALLFALVFCTVCGYFFFIKNISFAVFALQMGLVLAFIFIYAARFVGETRTRKQIEQVFGRFTSKAVVSQLVESGRMPELGGESVEISVLFSDIRNFTSMSERLQPQRVVEMINTYLGRASQCILDEDGNIDKFIGDAIMAEFGAPIHRADHARCAIKAALALQKNMENFRPWYRDNFPELVDFEFKIGIGIHSGTATMGNIGSANRLEYTALGDAVNVASRLEGVTKEIGCVIAASESTVRAAGAGVITGRSQALQVKGRTEPILVYEILGLEDAALAKA